MKILFESDSYNQACTQEFAMGYLGEGGIWDGELPELRYFTIF